MNLKLDLNGAWKMHRLNDTRWLPAMVPGSVYSNLLQQNEMKDPYFRENQYEACDMSNDDYEFSRTFDVTEELLAKEKLFLQFDGLDTLADVYLNGQFLGHADNMHRIWKYDVTNKVQKEENTLRVYFHSPIKYIKEKQDQKPLWGVATTISGYPHLRKAHYMFGWDWGPQLPDMGIWRPVSILGIDDAQLEGVYVIQEHRNETVKLSVQVTIDNFSKKSLTTHVVLKDPKGNRIAEGNADIDEKATVCFTVDQPQIWWPNGYGDHPLYTIETELRNNGECIDKRSQRIGLRTVTVSREEDQWGQEFCFMVNGTKIFAMGADYIPEDQIIARCSKEKTNKLLQDCVQANFNHVRVWGGGYYPEDYFYDLCDELGLLVWQDFMFACAVYRMDEHFTENIRIEIIENIKRIRHHACLALWCGNNEMETAWDSWGLPQDEELRADYLFQFEKLFPELCAEHDPQTFYWPSSPSSGGGFDDPNSYNRGDVHYWDVWHGLKPFTDFRKYYFRFCSEYGFMSLPSEKTVRDFALPEDLNLFSAVMEAHEKCDDGMKKILYYMSQIVSYPYSFQGVIYATQLMQADAIRSNVEHMRRNRGRCMGSTYWQINDSNPIISWASIDYDGRWKALHYYAKRFYAPVLISSDETEISAVKIWMSNEQFTPVNGTIKWTLRDHSAQILKQGDCMVNVEPMSSKCCIILDLSNELSEKEQKYTRYLEYTFTNERNEVVSCGSSLFTQPKHFRFLPAEIQVQVEEQAEAFAITLRAKTYAKSVCLDLKEADCQFSDNWVDIHGDSPVTIYAPKKALSQELSLEEFSNQLTVFSNNDL